MKLNRKHQDEFIEILAENDSLEEYRETFISMILERQTKNQYTRNDLLKKSTTELEEIYCKVK